MAVVCAASSRTASSHVQPSVNTNNRYIKLTTFADRVRLAYIIYIGEIPGQTARSRLDRDHDGVLSEAETAVFRDEWSKQVLDGLTVTSGGSRVPVVWESASVGLGDPRTSSGAFSVDLVGWLCGSGRQLRLVDRVVVPESGENEVLVEESPGVEITRAELAGTPGLKHVWKGSERPLDKGLVVEWRAAADAPPAPGKCPEPSSSKSKSSWLLPLAISAAALVGMFAVLFAWWRRMKAES